MLELLVIHPVLTMLGAALLLATIGILTQSFHARKTPPNPDLAPSRDSPPGTKPTNHLKH
jgi:hypothetical protein